MKKQIRLLFAAGGTGGHIFPALAVADKCRELYPDIQIEFVGTRGRLEEKVVPRAGYALNYLWISGFERKLSVRTMALPLKIGTSFAQALRIMRRFRPHAVICAGAYVSYPVGMMASFSKIPLVLMESNALPGMVIRRLAPRAAEIHVAFEATMKHLSGSRLFMSGNPVRKVFFQPIDQGVARAHFGLDANRPTLLAFGGSLGARSINNALDPVIGRLLESGAQVIWQTGTSYTGGERKEAGLYRSTFIHEMEMAYAAADLVLARAGATTIAELAAVGKPSVLVPLPTAADDHQRINAEAIRDSGAGEMLLDRELPEKLLPVITALLADGAKLQRMGSSIRRMGVPDADEKIARRVLALAGAD
ncbi:MAG: undecaprenyldiphospho-muramoylpentapeptide beta-N-acetylglucosaminyltransferase [Candidatus Kapaibacterium sp.]